MLQKLVDFDKNSLESSWPIIGKEAWKFRERAYILGNTKVGAIAVSEDGSIFGGCNIEHIYRCHDVHAEVNAISSMVAAGQGKLAVVLVAAERDFFTPCGGCMDWIFQFGGPDCIVAFQSKPTAVVKTFVAKELMPYYPR